MNATCLGLGLLLGWGAHAQPVRPVSTDGATLNVPSQYATIQAVIDAAETGDTIRVAPGRYNEHIRVENKDVTIIGTGGAAHSVIGTEGDAARQTHTGRR